MPSTEALVSFSNQLARKVVFGLENRLGEVFGKSLLARANLRHLKATCAGPCERRQKSLEL